MKIMERLPNSCYKIPYIDITNYEFNNDVNIVSKRFAKSNCMIPMELYGKILTVCIAKPTEELYRKLQKQTGYVIMIYKSCPDKINSMIESSYNKKGK